MNLNPIQTHILSKLYYSRSSRYSGLRPENVENDLYNYHLQMLVKKGWVQKHADGYQLSEQGIKYLTKISPTTYSGQGSDLFKVNALCFVIRQKSGIKEILQQTRLMHPFYGDTQVPGGMAKHGEKIEETASRKLFEETGLVSTSFKLGGVVRGSFYHKEQVLQDILYHVCFSELYEGELQEETVYGRNFWVPLADAIQNEKESTAPISLIVRIYSELQIKAFSDIPFFYEQETFFVERI